MFQKMQPRKLGNIYHIGVLSKIMRGSAPSAKTANPPGHQAEKNNTFCSFTSRVAVKNTGGIWGRKKVVMQLFSSCGEECSYNYYGQIIIISIPTGPLVPRPPCPPWVLNNSIGPQGHGQQDSSRNRAAVGGRGASRMYGG